MIDWAPILRPALATLEPYDPGASAAELARRYGQAELVPLHRNEDLFGPFPGALDAAADELAEVWRYPEDGYRSFQRAVAERHGIGAEHVVPGDGIQALIATIASALLDAGGAVVTPAPTYGLYAQVCEARGAAVHRVPLRELRIDLDALARAAHETGARIAWVCDPNNPTGTLVDSSRWRSFLDALPAGCLVVADEAYADFVEPGERIGRERDVEAGRPVVVLRTFSKLFGLAGLRLGYALADPALARILNVVAQPFNVNGPALAAGVACLRRPEAIEARRRTVVAARELLVQRLREQGIETHPTHANFVLARIGGDDAAFADALAARSGILVRPGGPFGLDGHVRITVGPAELMERVAAGVGELRAESAMAARR